MLLLRPCCPDGNIFNYRYVPNVIVVGFSAGTKRFKGLVLTGIPDWLES